MWSSLLGSLVPWLALMAAVVVAGDGVTVSSVVAAAPLYAVFVALPSMVAIVAGRWWAKRLAVTVVMTGVAAYAGVQMVTVDDGQAGLAVLWVPMAALPLGGIVWVGGAVVARYRSSGSEAAAGPARTSDRLAALVIDAVVAGAILVVPVKLLSDAKAEVAAAVVGAAIATVYLGAFVALAGRTPGQGLLGLTVVDHATGDRVPPGRALLRSLVVVAELATAVFAPVAVAEVIAVAASGRSLTDRLFRTSVVAAADS
ncbi:MAG: RDD family protein [Acidimicrobiales bacterium]